ncbi:MAG: hypothetical protein R3E99_08110 [Burkholderiaceae bacterium]
MNRSGLRQAVLAVTALLLLNGLLSVRNWWPTPAVLPDHRLAPELVGLWCVVLLVVAWRGTFPARALGALSALFMVLLLGRYANVTVPTLFGRPVNLYWDGQQIPRFLWVSAQDHPWWVSAGGMAGLVLLLVALYLLVRWALGHMALGAAPLALRSRWGRLPTVLASGLVVSHLAGWMPGVTWHLVAEPITPTYARQASLLATAFLPGRVDRVLPLADALETAMALPAQQALGALRGRDFKLLFLESYGAVAFEHPQAGPRLASARAQLARDIEDSGRLVASAYVRAATFAGASELSHLSLLSGVDLSDPLRHDLLLTTQRPTLSHLFRRAGYQTVGLYPALSWDWAERLFYGFDLFLDARDLKYEGPPLGYWKVPDQFSLARYEQLFPAAPGSPPRFLFFPTITSHLPFGPVPPFQPDWDRLLTPDPYGAAETARLRNAYVDWLDMMPNYVGMFDYTYRWLGAYLRRSEPRESVMLWLGDHQPAASVSGEGADWAVPVHVITRDPDLLRRFLALGFRPGLEPSRPVLGGLDDLNALLIKALDDRTGAPH